VIGKRAYRKEGDEISETKGGLGRWVKEILHQISGLVEEKLLVQKRAEGHTQEGGENVLEEKTAAPEWRGEPMTCCRAVNYSKDKREF